MSKRKLYDAVKAKVDAVEGFTFGGLFNNQFQKEAVEASTEWPIVYLEWASIDWLASVGTAQNYQSGDTVVCLHLGFKTIETDNSPLLDEVDRLYRALEGFVDTDNTFTPLRRIREAQDSETDNVFEWLIYFATKLGDQSAADASSTAIIAEGFTITRDLDIDNQIIRAGRD
jgi:hypothetical protein